ncbi:phosphoglycolate phosphatase-like HAD superfamily hydrolase [Sporomusaceae bacterium BoRhaA]|uniref:HAD family hydrolase n=1 Tax=Pelorhabdus rhamnosifermentans TaxID=2772457 RepID=UPI001C0611C7|nr:HAD hydrolase-like protein [Pelorhabdus rhamnosifermentans]MBU2699046.1 phosphoglycolate phosphatase-like HAD superfamily hydrolase [Pelorhabdus rhamnosifermentans]
MKLFNYIFTDLDGPILDGKYKHYNCYKDIITNGGGNAIDIDEYWEMKRNRVKRDVLLKISLYGKTYDDYLNEWLAKIEEIKYLDMDLLKPNVIHTLKKWEKITDNLYLVTARRKKENLYYQLNNNNLFELFDKIVCCDFGVVNSKYMSLKNISIDKYRGVFIGDTEEDMNTAELLQIKSIAITNGLREKKYLKANYYYDEIKDINISRC